MHHGNLAFITINMVTEQFCFILFDGIDDESVSLHVVIERYIIIFSSTVYHVIFNVCGF